MAAVTGIDLPGRRVQLDEGELTYDYLVIALGGRTSYFGHPEWAEFASGLKSLDDAMASVVILAETHVGDDCGARDHLVGFFDRRFHHAGV